MTLNSVHDLLNLGRGEEVLKGNLYDLIRLSKISTSSFWSGEEYIVHNTPQQGINWIGQWPFLRAVIVKTRIGAYGHDGWVDEAGATFRYSFKARSGKIDYKEKANVALIEQPRFSYPVCLFTDQGKNWRLEGNFFVTDIADEYVILSRSSELGGHPPLTGDEVVYAEGGRRYVSHLMTERSRKVVDVLKSVTPWKCGICEEDFYSKYRMNYIEAHHKIPISTYSSTQNVCASDFALLCPNCHKAVHLYMQRDGLEYDAIRELLSTLHV